MPACCYMASAAIWCDWCDSTTSTSCTTGSAWHYWTDGTSSTCTSTNTASTIAWRAWSACSAAATTPEYQPYRAPELTPEERAKRAEERERQAEAARVAAEKAAREAELAKAKAEKLLHELLDAEQKKQYAESKTFDVIGADSERYRVRDGWAGHVERIKDGKPIERFCIHPRERVPEADNQLIAKLMLETDPAGFRKIANVTRLLQPAG